MTENWNALNQIDQTKRFGFPDAEKLKDWETSRIEKYTKIRLCL